MGVKWQGGEGVFIGLESSVRLVLRAYIRVPFTSDPKVASYIGVF